MREAKSGGRQRTRDRYRYRWEEIQERQIDTDINRYNDTYEQYDRRRKETNVHTWRQRMKRKHDNR